MRTTDRTTYLCSTCDATSVKWTGQCLSCGAWGSMAPVSVSIARRAETRGRSGTVASTPFDAVVVDTEERAASGIEEFDRVLGGGFVRGSVTLIGGEPGIGKSTLALILCATLAKAGSAVYCSGEESAAQVRMRLDRLGLPTDGMRFLGETDVDVLAASLEKERPSFAVIDSVQTLTSLQVPAEAGGVAQVRYAASRLVAFAKSVGVPILLIGHVTKDGHVAGPKTLEHLVDTVLSFEGERSHGLRILRGLKNRFGATDEAGMFTMEDGGLKEVRNPSAYLLDARRPGTPGSVTSCVMEGSRPLLVEVQALVQKSHFGYPLRRASGFDLQRLEMIIAVLAKRAGMDVGQQDIYVNVVGGMKLKEPAADLAVAAALVSASLEQPVDDGAVVWGEIGLGGETRPAAATDRRIKEAANLGRTVIVAPRHGNGRSVPKGVRLVPVATVREMQSALFPKR